MAVSYYLSYGAGGAVTGAGATPDGTIPAGAIACTEAQYLASSSWAVSNGALVAAPAAPAPTLSQQAATMLAAGIGIVSTATPALNGTYACDPATYQRIGGIVAAIGAGLGLPGGGATFNWPDASGSPHAFGAADFKDFATAVMNFEYALNAIIGSDSGTLPAATATIA